MSTINRALDKKQVANLSVFLTLMISEEMLRDLKDAAYRHDVSRADIVRHAIEQFLAHDGARSSPNGNGTSATRRKRIRARAN